jgi:hypothetical protein
VARFLLPPERCAGFPEVCLVRDGSLFLTRLALPLGWHIGLFGSYEPELREIMRTALPLGGTAIDVGANAGWHTLLMVSSGRSCKARKPASRDSGLTSFSSSTALTPRPAPTAARCLPASSATTIIGCLPSAAIGRSSSTRGQPAPIFLRCR